MPPPDRKDESAKRAHTEHTDEKLLEAIEEMEMEDALDDVKKMSDEEVSRSIAADGGDPKAIGARGAALAATLLERRKRQVWQVDPHEKLEAARAKIGEIEKASASRPRLSRAAMIARIDEARRDATFAAKLAARKGGTDEATDDELDDLLRQLEILRATRDERDERDERDP